MVLSTIFVGLMYVLGSIAVGLVVPTAALQNNFANGIFDVFDMLSIYIIYKLIVSNNTWLIMRK